MSTLSLATLTRGENRDVSSPFAFDAAAYLDRIAYHGSTEPTVATLRALSLAHLRAVPFENLDIPRGRSIHLDETALFAKIVRRRRGGFCYELNGLFASLLCRLGFGVSLLAAQFPRPAGVATPEYDHLTLLVTARHDPGPWLADVGAGRGSFTMPLPADSLAAQPQPLPDTGVSFRLAPEGDRRRLMRRDGDGSWEASYAFDLRPRRLADFEAGCIYHQTSPDSPFTQGRICSLATPAGRITLTERRLIVTDDGRRSERDVPEDEVPEVLRSHFGIELESTDWAKEPA